MVDIQVESELASEGRAASIKIIENGVMVRHIRASVANSRTVTSQDRPVIKLEFVEPKTTHLSVVK